MASVRFAVVCPIWAITYGGVSPSANSSDANVRRSECGVNLLEYSEARRVPRLPVECSPSAHRPVPRRTVADPVARQFGAAVREARRQRGETLEQVAYRIERRGAKYLGEIESGWHAPTIPTAKRIADALAVTLAELTECL
jgi:ribosome-binding protein aMBF1 (putative translation factor)